MSKMKYKILVPEDEVVYKDDGKRLVLLLTDPEDETCTQIYQMYETYINHEFFRILSNVDYSQKDEKRLYEEIHQVISDKKGPGIANDLCSTFLHAVYIADRRTGTTLYCNIKDIDSVIQWNKEADVMSWLGILSNRVGKKWVYPIVTCIVGIVIGVLISVIPKPFSDSKVNMSPTAKTDIHKNTPKVDPKYKINAVYDPKTCTIYFSDNKYETIDYYIDYQKKIKKIDDINWKLQSSTISVKDTLFLKDNCTVYLRGELGTDITDIQSIEVSYLDFIKELLVTQDPIIKSMLVTNSSTPFGNTTFLVDGVPQQASYYKSSELKELIKNGYKVTAIKTIGSNLNPTNKRYPKLGKITIQKQ